jgi:phospholipid/cholesterol/gamma-HCH transport system substrate-binding protein
MEQAVIRRIAGAAGALLLVALSWLGMDYAFSPPKGSFHVTAVLGQAGSGLNEGTDVKVRGVRIGKVSDLRFEDGVAEATLQIDPGTEVPMTGLDMVVTAKTLLGEKQIELSFPDDAFGQPPFLSEGDVLEASREPTELQEVLDAMRPFLDAIDPQDIATIVDVLGEQQGEGENIARNLELSAEVARFLDRTADDAINNLVLFTQFADGVTAGAEDFARMNRNLPAAVALMHERTDDIDTNLKALSSFAVTFAAYLEVEEDRIDRVLTTGDAVGAVLEPEIGAWGSFLEGLFHYTQNLGRPAGILSDGTEWAAFRILVDLSHFGLPVGDGGVDLRDLIDDVPASADQEAANG